MSRPALLRLADLSPEDDGRVGGKAANLGRLARAGLPVPRGFVLPAEALAEELAAAGLSDLAARVEAEPSAEATARLRASLEGLALTPALERALRGAARRLGPRVAVRSSAVGEDGHRASFAGQHATLLEVEPHAVPRAVCMVWASLYADAALAYRHQRGGGEAPAMAVVVQRLVRPESAGVMFTVNPLSGSWREMTVEATWGLAEDLVSGAVTPHWFLVRRPRRAPRPVQRVLSRVQLHVVQEDLPEIPSHPSRRGERTLSRADLLRLCRLGLRAEALLGAPQDVEWALGRDGRLHLLQSRPITASSTPRGRADVLWTRRFIGERWPEPATVLGWSIVRPILEWFIAYPGTQGRYLGGGPAVRLVRSRPYINATVFRHLAFKIPGAPPPRFMLEFFPPEEEAAWQRRFAMVPDATVYASILRETLLERRWRRFRWNPLTNHRAWDAFEARMAAELPPLCREPDDLSDAVALSRSQHELVREYCKVHVTSLLFANLLYQLLEGALHAATPERAAWLMDRLATCPPGNKTLAANEALWALAHAGTEAHLEALERGEPPAADTPFGRALDEVLEAYGHRSDASWEIFATRWREDPARLVPLLRHHREGVEPPAAHAVRQVEAFEAAQAELRRLLDRSPWRRPLERLVWLTRRYLLLRENQRFWFDRLLFAAKTTLLWVGAVLADRGWLDEAADVSFLSWDEVVGLAEGTLDPEPVAGWVERRRARREEDLAVEPPTFLRGDEAIAPPVRGARLQGLGISPGRARGRVRVLSSPAEADRLEPGDVLVTRAVDPGWTPLFLTAGAVVLEMGSRLSHGAVIAREYGVPAVVNLDGITRALSDGQEVTVDGTRGIVWVHP